MDVPEGFTPDNRLPFQAQIIWSRPDADPSFYNTGFEFIGLSGREQELIARMIQDERWTLLDTGNTPAEPYNSSGEHQFGEFRPPSTLGEAYAGSGPD